jgi:hypothetical protein
MSERTGDETDGRTIERKGETRWGGIMLVGLSAAGFVTIAALAIRFVSGLIF